MDKVDFMGKKKNKSTKRYLKKKQYSYHKNESSIAKNHYKSKSVNKNHKNNKDKSDKNRIINNKDYKEQNKTFELSNNNSLQSVPLKEKTKNKTNKNRKEMFSLRMQKIIFFTVFFSIFGILIFAITYHFLYQNSQDNMGKIKIERVYSSTPIAVQVETFQKIYKNSKNSIVEVIDAKTGSRTIGIIVHINRKIYIVSQDITKKFSQIYVKFYNGKTTTIKSFVDIPGTNMVIIIPYKWPTKTFYASFYDKEISPGLLGMFIHSDNGFNIYSISSVDAINIFIKKGECILSSIGFTIEGGRGFGYFLSHNGQLVGITSIINDKRSIFIPSTDLKRILTNAINGNYDYGIIRINNLIENNPFIYNTNSSAVNLLYQHKGELYPLIKINGKNVYSINEVYSILFSNIQKKNIDAVIITEKGIKGINIPVNKCYLLNEKVIKEGDETK